VWEVIICIRLLSSTYNKFHKETIQKTNQTTALQAQIQFLMLIFRVVTSSQSIHVKVD